MGKGRTLVGLLIGFGIGVGVTLLLAPQSGEDTRDWIAHLTPRQAQPAETRDDARWTKCAT